MLWQLCYSNNLHRKVQQSLNLLHGPLQNHADSVIMMLIVQIQLFESEIIQTVVLIKKMDLGFAI